MKNEEAIGTLTTEVGFIHENIKLRKHAKEFNEIFGVDMSDYFDNITGFDIIKFDRQVIKSSEDESCSYATKKQFGKKAVDLIKQLL